MLHHRLPCGPVLVRNHQLHKPVRLILPFRRRREVVALAAVVDVGEMAWDEVLACADRAGEHVSKRHRARKLLVPPGEEDRLLVQLALEALHGEVVASRVLHALHVLEVEKPRIAIRHKRRAEAIDHERQVGRLGDVSVVAILRLERLAEIDGRDGAYPVASDVGGIPRQLDGVLGAHRAHMGDELAAALRRLNRAPVHLLALRNAHQQSFSGAAS